MSGGWRQRILFTFPKSKNSPLSRTGFFRQFSLFCLVITSYNVKGYAAFHKLRPLMRCPKFFAHSRLHSRFLLCKNRCCDEPCFAARNRFVNSFTRPKSKNSPLSRTGFFRQFSLFCLVITSYNVKGYAAFHKLRPLMRCPKFFAHSRLHSRFLLCKNRCCDEPCFAARNRFVNPFTRPKSKNSPLSRTVFVFWGG